MKSDVEKGQAGREKKVTHSVACPAGSTGPTLLSTERLYPDAIFLTDLHAILLE